jgi:hypothetical protein
MSIPDLIVAIEARIRAFEAGEGSGVLDPQALTMADDLMRHVGSGDPYSMRVAAAVARLHWCRYNALPEGQDQDDLQAALVGFARIIAVRPDLVPADVLRLFNASPPGAAPSDPREMTFVAAALMVHVQQTDEPAVLELAIVLAEAAVAATPAQDPDFGMMSATLGAALRVRFERTGDLADIDAAITAGQAAVAATPASDPDYASMFSPLGAALTVRFEHTGDLADIDAAISAGQMSMSAVGTTDTDHSDTLSTLGVALRVRFERTGDLADLNAAIAIGQRAVAATDHSSPEQAMCQANLGTSLLTRFERTGDLADLNAAIAIGQAAIAATSPGHLHYATYQANLGVALRVRFERVGDQADLNAAIAAAQAAVAATSPGHPFRAGMLSTLGSALLSRFERVGHLADIDAAVDAHRAAVAATSPGHTQHAGILSNLGAALRARFGRTGDQADIDAAITTGKAAADATGTDHPQYAMNQMNLASALRARFEHTGDQADIDAAITTGKAAVAATSPDHPDRTMRQANLSGALQVRFERTGDLADIDAAIAAQRQAIDVVGAPAGIRMLAAQGAAWAVVKRGQAQAADSADQEHGLAVIAAALGAALPLYRQAIELLPEVVLRGLGRADLQRLIRDHGTLGTDAAACAIATGQPELAIQVLEQARSVLWGQMLDQRTDLTDLRTAWSDYAAELEACIAILNQPDANRGASHAEAATAAASSDQGRVAAGQHFNHLVQRIRALPATPAFPYPDQFLRLSPLADLLPPPDTGPVVVVNISRWRCDALIVTSTGIELVPLAITDDDVRDHTSQYLAAQSQYDAATLDMRLIYQTSMEKVTTDLLGWLWDAVTEPVLNRIGTAAHGDSGQLRVWWCPTGPLTLLPVHAAGHHLKRDGRTVIDQVISSYIPTLRALAAARGKPASRHPRDMLAVTIADTPSPEDSSLGFDHLPGATAERRLMISIFGHRHDVLLTDLPEHSASRIAITTALATHRWAHIACHGTQNLIDPASAGLVPYDWQTAGLVGLGDLTGPAHTGGDFAFLSACQTATGGVTNLDEAVNLTAAMQYVGWRHVIGTLWTINDSTAADIARLVYDELVTDSVLDADRSAIALHHAVKHQRDQNPLKPSLWARYIHTGP